MTAEAREGAGVAAFVAVGALVCAALLVAPGQTVVSVYANDLFIFLDGAHRVAAGQAPNRDFHTALGPLVFYLPAAGYALTGSLGLAMPAAMALVLAGLAPPMAWILGSRVRPLLALPFAAFLLLVVAVPMNLGEAVSALSFAMFYNRIGWAALALLAAMALTPRQAVQGRLALDAASAVLLAGLLVYTKASYGAVALALIGLLLVYPAHRAWAALALAALAVLAVLVEAVWGGSAGYIDDLRTAGAVSGAFRGGVVDLADAAMRHLADGVLVGLLAILAVRRSPTPWRDVLFYGFCAGAGLAIMIQNAQGWGILTLHAAALVAAERLMRGAPGAYLERPWSPRAGAPLLLVALVLPTVVHCAAALGLHAALAAERPVSRFGLPGYDRIRVAEPWPMNDYGFSVRFRDGLSEGAEALRGLDPSRVVVLDFVNAFSAGLGIAPARGDSSWLHWGRNVDAGHHIPPGDLLADARIVLVPKPGINGPPLWDIYGPAVEAGFELVRETGSWRVYRRREPPAVVSEAR
ncbi:hypothetical protein [Salinarimonas soli]|uniref:DUF2079 domain-containing protein n=1 Tax=Salinarimonas soli TaxID=1638099 RepID=A0A5B2V8S5_9HYPH|nr:hypothetical protein [Salinarimonas soli]KAA2234975.1 hypothetical protein F0L46_21785 [Salinarimonas soli]